jgi:hypothetical protein
MAITLKQLQEHLPSPEEQEASARQAITQLLSSISQQFENVLKAALSGILQHIQLMPKTFGVTERYWMPAYIPPPPYLRQSQPQIIYVYIHDLPSLN